MCFLNECLGLSLSDLCHLLHIAEPKGRLGLSPNIHLESTCDGALQFKAKKFGLERLLTARKRI